MIKGVWGEKKKKKKEKKKGIIVVCSVNQFLSAAF